MGFQRRASRRISAEVRRWGLAERDPACDQSKPDAGAFPGCVKSWRKIDIGCTMALSPADRNIDYWRIAPPALYRMTSPKFEKVSLFFIGSIFDLPGRIASRLLSGGFRGFSRAATSRSGARPLCPADEGRIPTSFIGPLTTLILAENYRSGP